MENSVALSDNSEYDTLITQIEHPKKLAFLENYPHYARTNLTAYALGLNESTIYVWLKKDETFNQAFQALKKRIDTDRLEQVEKEIHTRAMGNTSKMSDVLLMFEAKALNPSKYREKAFTETKLTGNITVKMAIPEYKDDIPQITTELALQEGQS